MSNDDRLRRLERARTEALLGYRAAQPDQVEQAKARLIAINMQIDALRSADALSGVEDTITMQRPPKLYVRRTGSAELLSEPMNLVEGNSTVN